MLPIPEMVPFRMTPMIQGLMHPFKHHGLFKDSMISLLQKLQENEDILMTTLSIFIKDPSMDWIKQKEMLRQQGSITKMASDRIQWVKDKLRCQDPTEILLRMLKSYKSKWAKAFEPSMSQHRLPHEDLNPEGVARCLINLATEGALLSKAYWGWSPIL